MFSAAYLCICLYSMLVLGFLFFMENRRRNARSGNERYFLLMLVIALLSFVADIMSSLYAGPEWFFPFAAAGNYIEILLNTSLIPIFYWYICEQIPSLNKAVRNRLSRLLWMMTALCVALGIYNIFSGQIFYFDSAHLYHRGPFFIFPMLILLAMMLIVEGFLVSQREKIEAKYYKSLLFFLIFPLIGWALQCFIFGLPFSLLGITFAALVLFTNIQNRNMDKDYLTGAFNRQTLDRYMQHKINAATRQKTFSAILLDIDQFKEINDNFGHFEGDTALINTVSLLRSSVSPADFIARYGGDEFCVILESDDPKTVGETIRKINSSLSDFNKGENKPYRLRFSMGCAIYDRSVGDSAQSFLRVIDQKMYRNKTSHKAAAHIRVG